MWKYGIAALIVILVALGAAIVWTRLADRHVVDELTSQPQSERAQKVMLLTLPSGRTIPVNYLREGDRVYAGADGRWWRELREGGAPVTAVVLGESLSGHGVAVEDDPDHTRDVFSRLRPTVPAWLPEALDGVLVEIQVSPKP